MFGLVGRLFVLFSIPVVSAFKRASAGTELDQAVAQYSTELILVLCGVMMIVGCLASSITKDPDGVTATSFQSKAISSLFGSLIAICYLVYSDQEVSLIHAVWIGGVSFVSPQLIPSLKSVVRDLIPTAQQAIKDFAEKWAKGGKS